ncbi:hypothetical protein [Lactobacillus sp.]|uniref:hypothetical protein n=1 Tax=Lactobacillus sp. TaxID=1591 RepID=UPI0019865279|nr:hypothetical protein [Lactobacillus sp.]MBD5429153.1 hypothetical protein [Lactobacillus sp.]
MYDYRTDIINLMRSTEDNEQSLKQSMVALKLIVKMVENSIAEDKNLAKHEKETNEKLEKLLENEPHTELKQEKGKRKVKIVKKKSVSEKKKGKSDRLKKTDALYVPQIDFDLHGQNVGIVCAQEEVSRDARKVVVAHNGKAKLLTNEDKDTITDSIKGLDIVIAIKHDVSRAILDILYNLSQGGKFQYGVAGKISQLSVEKALYRSDNQLGTFDTNALKYPSANLKSLLLASQIQIPSKKIK